MTVENDWHFVGEPGELQFEGGWRNLDEDDLRRLKESGLPLPPLLGYILTDEWWQS